jgi:hypothetical protein
MEFKMRTSIIATSLALGLFAATSAQAAPVTTWGYSVNTQWIAPTTFTGSGGTQIVSANEISWGGDNNGVAAGVGNLIVGGGERSGVLVANTAPVGATVTTNGGVSPTAQFSHINNPISASFGTLLTATVQTTLTLQALNPIPGLAQALPQLVFNINFAETSNNNNCVVGATSNCDDVFVITFGALNNIFNYDGLDYFVSIVNTSGPLNPLHPTACAAAGVNGPCLGFLTREGERTDVDFGILISARPVQIPEPGILGLLGLGMLGLFLSRRRTAV